MTCRLPNSIDDVAEAFASSGYDVRYDRYWQAYFIRRNADSLAFKVSYARVDRHGVDALLQPFRDHDAAQATPGHWMAL